jgi:hypothetical protein
MENKERLTGPQAQSTAGVDQNRLDLAVARATAGDSAEDQNIINSPSQISLR